MIHVAVGYGAGIMGGFIRVLIFPLSTCISQLYIQTTTDNYCNTYYVYALISNINVSKIHYSVKSQDLSG